MRIEMTLLNWVWAVERDSSPINLWKDEPAGWVKHIDPWELKYIKPTIMYIIDELDEAILKCETNPTLRYLMIYQFILTELLDWESWIYFNPFMKILNKKLEKLEKNNV